MRAMSTARPVDADGPVRNLQVPAAAVACWVELGLRLCWDGGLQGDMLSDARLAADCRSLLIEKCPGCIVCARRLFSAPCLLEFGACGCVYHGHCLAPWLAKRWVCPVDEREWVASTPRLDCAGFAGLRRQEC
jgi:RING-box protein 1